MTLSLVERRRSQTRREIAQAALGLFQRDGYRDVSVDAIAQESGVSLRTFYRYFQAKEEVLTPILEVGTEDLLAALIERPADESLTCALRRAYADIPPRTGGAATVRSLIKLLLDEPALHARWLAHMGTMEDQLVPFVRERANRELPELQARLTAATITAYIRTTFETWALSNSEERISEAFSRALDFLDDSARASASPPARRR